jgi:hypothetical protein
MKAMNEIEKKVLEMVKNGEKLHGWALDVLMEMTLREMEKKD